MNSWIVLPLFAETQPFFSSLLENRLYSFWNEQSRIVSLTSHGRDGKHLAFFRSFSNDAFLVITFDNSYYHSGIWKLRDTG